MNLVVHFERDSCDVYIGRPSKWSCPYQIGIDGTKEEVLYLFEEYLYAKPHLVQMVVQELPNKKLGCYCEPEYNCHGELLARIANSWQLCLPILGV